MPVTVFRKINQLARKSIIPYTRKYTSSTKMLIETKRVLLVDGASDWLQIRTAASSLDVKGNKAIKRTIVFLADRLVFLNTVTYEHIILVHVCMYTHSYYTGMYTHTCSYYTGMYTHTCSYYTGTCTCMYVYTHRFISEGILASMPAEYASERIGFLAY